MKILFLIFHGFSDYSGISKKIFSQVEGLKENGHKVMLCYYTIDEAGHRKRMIDKSVLDDYGCGIFAPIKKRICYNAIVNSIIQNNIELVYIRSDHNANPFTIHFLKRLKQNGIRTAMEIPTYPYDNEYKDKNLRSRFELFTDKLFRKKLVKQLNGVVTFSNFTTIFGGKAINISNGINFNQVKIKHYINDTSKQLNLVGVAEVHNWHGFDRVIKGLINYYKKPQLYKVFFHIIGGIGPVEKKEYEQLVRDNKLEKYVIFHGSKFGKELDRFFELSDMGIGSLARHRSQIYEIKTLKNREYAARGIPFIYSEKDDDFENMPYILKAPADESPIGIENLISFYKKQDTNPQKIRESIQHLSWKNQMREVLIQTFNKKDDENDKTNENINNYN